MKTRYFLLIPILLVFILASCQIPQPPSKPAEDAQDGCEGTLSIETDLARNQGVLINEKGIRIDIMSEEADGSIVKCIEAVDLAVLDPEESAFSGDSYVKALVIGKREDGDPGIWLVYSDNSIHSAYSKCAGRNTSELFESLEMDEGMRGRFGWTYYVTGISEDGRTVVGYAENNRGYHGRWKIDPGTTVGVYWKVLLKPGFPHYIVSRARVIGTIDPPQMPPTKNRWEKWLRWHMRRLLHRLKLFFLNYLESYLIMADSVHFDEDNDVYIVAGTDQDGNEAVATIDKQDKITIEQVEEPGTDKPDLLVSSVIVPDAPRKKSDQWTLGAAVQNDGPAAAGASTIEYRLSSDETLDSNDVVIRSVPVPALDPGGSFIDDSDPETYSIPDSGTYYIFATVDPENNIEEIDEDNNTSSAVIAIIYDRIIIDTYKPTTGGFIKTDTFLTLFNDQGDKDEGDPWIDPDAPPESIAEDDYGNDWFYPFARIDYTEGLVPGTYYIRVRLESITDQAWPYAIRVVTDIDPLDQYPAAEDWFFGTTNNDDSPYEPDDSLLNGVPVKKNVITLGEKHNRYLETGDVDWFELELP